MVVSRRCPLCLREDVEVRGLQRIIGRRVTCPTWGQYDIANLESVVGFNAPDDSSGPEISIRPAYTYINSV